jgi:hypothetical protein
MTRPISSGEISSLPVAGTFEKSSTGDDKVSDVYGARQSAMRPSWVKHCPLEGCHKQIPLAMQGLVCKCGKVFCLMHLSPTDHRCTFDWTADYRNKVAQASIDKDQKPYTLSKWL